MSYCLYNDNKMYQIDIYAIWLATGTWQGYTLPDKGLVPDISHINKRRASLLASFLHDICHKR